MFLDDPEMPLQWLSLNQVEHLGEGSQYMRTTLIDNAQHDQAGIVFGWIDRKVGKVQVECDNCPSFFPAPLCDGRVVFTAQPFTVHSLGVRSEEHTSEFQSPY